MRAPSTTLWFVAIVSNQEHQIIYLRKQQKEPIAEAQSSNLIYRGRHSIPLDQMLDGAMHRKYYCHV